MNYTDVGMDIKARYKDFLRLIMDIQSSTAVLEFKKKQQNSNSLGWNMKDLGEVFFERREMIASKIQRYIGWFGFTEEDGEMYKELVNKIFAAHHDLEDGRYTVDETIYIMRQALADSLEEKTGKSIELDEMLASEERERDMRRKGQWWD